MTGAGVLSPVTSRRRRAEGVSVSLTGLTGGVAEHMTSLSFTHGSETGPEAIRWQTSQNGIVWADIPGATGPSEMIDLTGPTHGDEGLIRVGVTFEGQERFSAPARMVYAMPVSLAALPDQEFLISSGAQSFATADAFAGDDLTFGLSPLVGATIDPASGQVSIDTNLWTEPSTATLTVTASNSGGSASSFFSLTVGLGAFALENIDNEPVITADAGALTISVTSGVYAGTYTTDYLGTPLEVAAIEAAPMCLALPNVSGGTAAGETLTITPGLWLYAGDDPGDQTWQQRLDGADVMGGTGLSYVIAPEDEGKSFTVTETFAGAMVSSTPFVLSSAVSALDNDPNVLFRYRAEDVQFDAANAVTSWPNASGNADYDLTEIPIAAPIWTGSSVSFDGLSQALRSGVNITTPVKTHVTDNGDTLVLMMVVETKSGETRGILSSIGPHSGFHDAYAVGFASSGGGASDADIEIYRSARGADYAVGTDFGDTPTIGVTPSGKMLIEFHLSQDTFSVYIDGNLEVSESVIASNLPSSAVSRMALGGRAEASNVQRPGHADIYEVFCTTSVAEVQNFRDELNFRHGL